MGKNKRGWDLVNQALSVNRVNHLFQFSAFTIHTITDGFSCRYETDLGVSTLVSSRVILFRRSKPLNTHTTLT